MRKTGVLILCVLLVSLATPLLSVRSIESADNTAMLLTLDVCDASGSSLSANQDMPSLYEGTCKILPLEFAGFHKAGKPVFSFLLMPSLEELPPKV